MKLVFVSNMLNHHQEELCREFQNNFDDFEFIATKDAEKIGYQKTQDADFVIPYYKDRRRALESITSADVVIFGDCPNSLINMRLDNNKLSFLYSERFFKKGVWRRRIPTTNKTIQERIGQYKNKNMYVLCASAFLSYDLSLVGFPIEKCFKWGYFPQTKDYVLDELLKVKQNEKTQILWAGRLLDWKHPEMAVKLAERLRQDKIEFEIKIIGSGPLENKIEKLIKKKQLENCVFLLGSMAPEQVRKNMEKADIFLTSSDFYEGWGAVLNEAMNSGCAVLASHAAGSTPYLVDSGVNGAIYKFGNMNMLYNQTKKYVENIDYMRRIQISANETIRNVWNAKVAASNFRKLVEMIIHGQKEYTEFGPCSPATIVENNWYKG